MYNEINKMSTLSAIFSRKQWRLPNPSAAKQTRSPVAVHERHTMSSYNKKKLFKITLNKIRNNTNNILYNIMLNDLFLLR